MTAEETVKFMLINTANINTDLMMACRETADSAWADGKYDIAEHLCYQAVLYRRFIDKLEARVAALEGA